MVSNTTAVVFLIMAVITITISTGNTAGPYKGGISYRANYLRSKYGDAIDAIFGIGIRSTAILADPSTTGNVIVSPVSITLLMGQILLGAEGAFREQLYNLMSLTRQRSAVESGLFGSPNSSYYLPYSKLHFQLSGLLKELSNVGNVPRNFTLHDSSALFHDKSLVLDRSFTKYLKLFYDTYIQPLDFAGNPEKALNVMDKWAEEQTKGLIKSLMSSPPSESNAAVFANALYFAAEWETPFSQELNRDGVFSIKKDRQVNVTYMFGFLDDIQYAETPQYKMICLPYKNRELGMYLLLPRADNEHAYDIRQFQQKLNETEILKTIKTAKRNQVAVKLPKMSLSSKISILRPLQKYVAFKKQTNKKVVTNDTWIATDQLANLVQDFVEFNATDVENVRLTGAAANADLEISDIVQQLTLSVNEKGTEAAAVTAGIIDYIGGSKGFAVDRPFVFFVLHEDTSVVLFWGAISNPVENAAS